MNCNQYLPLIEELADNELDEATARKVTAYLATCPECAAYYENLKHEKEAYSHYLFNAEPPADLWKNFQTKMQAEKENQSQPKAVSSIVSGWKLKFTFFPRLVPGVAFAALLLAFGLGYVFLKSTTSEKPPDGAFAANANSAKDQGENLPRIAQSAETKSGSNGGEINQSVSKFDTKQPNNSPGSGARTQVIKARAPLPNRAEKARKLLINRRENQAEQPAKLSEEEKLQVLALKNLEIESATQIEKVELLLRSFRNASNGEGETADVSYEKQQARRLLDKNAQLRQAADFYGAVYTGEVLSRVEPVLLDIANLDLSAPSAKKVQDIKERVRNQNLIASLQTY